VGYIISLLKQVDSEDGTEYILLEDLVKLALFKLPHLPLEKALNTLCGSVASAQLEIYDF
jgi:hypothetical protein